MKFSLNLQTQLIILEKNLKRLPKVNNFYHHIRINLKFSKNPRPLRPLKKKINILKFPRFLPTINKSSFIQEIILLKKKHLMSIEKVLVPCRHLTRILLTFKLAKHIYNQAATEKVQQLTAYKNLSKIINKMTFLI